MKVGSIVECIDNRRNSPNPCITPMKKRPYTVRDVITMRGVTVIRLEEIINPICDWPGMLQIEWTYEIEMFREIEFPDDLQEEIKECLTREFESV